MVQEISSYKNYSENSYSYEFSLPACFQSIEEYTLPIQTRYGICDFRLENMPNNMGKKREYAFQWIADREKAYPGHAYGFLAEAIALNLFSRIVPDFQSVPAPHEFDCTEKDAKGADILILERKVDDFKGAFYDPVILVDVTTRSSRALHRKKQPGINSRLESPVIVLPLGDLYTTDDTRISYYFSSIMWQSLQSGIINPFIGIQDEGAFMQGFQKTVLTSIVTARARLEYKYTNREVLRETYKQTADKLDYFEKCIINNTINQLI